MRPDTLTEASILRHKSLKKRAFPTPGVPGGNQGQTRREAGAQSEQVSRETREMAELLKPRKEPKT
jgi:hypothetical protein